MKVNKNISIFTYTERAGKIKISERTKAPLKSEELSSPASPEPQDKVTITIIHTNDMHGKYRPTHSGMGGMPYVATVVKEIRRRYPDAILVDVGDTVYNPPYSKKHRFQPMVQIMNAMNYQIEAIGNHEFQYGVPTLVKEFVKQVKFPVLNSNLLFKETGELPEGVQPYLIMDIKGVKVAFIGVSTTRLATNANPHVGRDVIKIPIREALAKYVPEVKRKGADVVIVLAHEGVNKLKEILSSIPEIAKDIDVVMAGHDHTLTEKPRKVTIKEKEAMALVKYAMKPYKAKVIKLRVKVSSKTHTVYIVEAGSHTKYVGFSQLTIDKNTKELVKFTMKPIPVKSKEIKPDPEIQRIIENYESVHGLVDDPEEA